MECFWSNYPLKVQHVNQLHHGCLYYFKGLCVTKQKQKTVHFVLVKAYNHYSQMISVPSNVKSYHLICVLHHTDVSLKYLGTEKCLFAHYSNFTVAIVGCSLSPRAFISETISGTQLDALYLFSGV